MNSTRIPVVQASSNIAAGGRQSGCSVGSVPVRSVVRDCVPRLVGFCLLFVLALGQKARVHAQDAVIPGEETVRWYGGAGVLGFVDDAFEEPEMHVGPIIHGGATWNGLGIGLSAVLLPDINDSRLFSIETESSLDLISGQVVGLAFVVGAGWTRTDFQGDLSTLPEGTRVIEVNGPSATFGFRFRIQVHEKWHTPTGLYVNTTEHGWSILWRATIARSSRAVVPETSASVDVGPAIYYMVPVAGPWVFVEPAYGVFLRRNLSDHLAATATLLVYHWQIPGQAFQRDYLWDTGSFVILPALEWSPGPDAHFAARLGPAIMTMGEGPDSGVSTGPNIEVEVRKGAFRLGAGWMWVFRGHDDDPDYSGDQHGLMVFGGFAF